MQQWKSDSHHKQTNCWLFSSLYFPPQVDKYVTQVRHVNASRRVMELYVKYLKEDDLRGYHCHANNSEGVAQARILLHGKYLASFYNLKV